MKRILKTSKHSVPTLYKPPTYQPVSLPPPGTINLEKSYYHSPNYQKNFQDFQLDYATLGDTLLHSATTKPDHTAMDFLAEKNSYTWGELLTSSLQLASALKKYGLKKSDRVAVWMPNLSSWPVIQMASSLGGFVLVPMNPLYTKHESDFVIKNTQPKAIFTIPNLRGIQPYSKHLESHPDVLQVYDYQNMFNSEKDELKRENCVDYNDFMNSGCNSGNFFNDATPDDTVLIGHTSGTTGKPKGAKISHFSLANQGKFGGMRSGLGSEHTRILCNVPLFHAFGYVGALAIPSVWGITSLFPAPGFDVNASLAATLNNSPTSFFGTPTMFVDFFRGLDKMEKEGKFNMSDFKIEQAVFGGGLVPPSLAKRCREMDIGFTIAFGMTETTAIATGHFIEEKDDELLCNTVGIAYDHVELKVVDTDSGNVTDIGDKGEVCIRGYNTMQGYWNDEAKTREVLDENNWYSTGDLGVMDKNGYLSIVGRSKDMIIRGGENIYPAEIEDVLREHGKIADAQVVGRPDERLGEEVAVYVLPKTLGEEVDVEELKKFCSARLARFKVPKYWKIVEDYPKTISGKVQKFILRDESVKDFE